MCLELLQLGALIAHIELTYVPGAAAPDEDEDTEAVADRSFMFEHALSFASRHLPREVRDILPFEMTRLMLRTLNSVFSAITGHFANMAISGVARLRTRLNNIE